MIKREFRFPEAWYHDRHCLAAECAAMLDVEPTSKVFGHLTVEPDDDDDTVFHVRHHLTRLSDGRPADVHFGVTVTLLFNPCSDADGLLHNLCHPESEDLLNKVLDGHKIETVDGGSIHRGTLTDEAREALLALEASVDNVSTYDVVDAGDYSVGDDSEVLRIAKSDGVDYKDLETLTEWAKDCALIEEDVLLYGVDRWASEIIVRWADAELEGGS